MAHADAPLGSVLLTSGQTPSRDGRMPQARIGCTVEGERARRSRPPHKIECTQ